MSTASLRRDHDLIEKVIKSMETTIQLLQENKTVPEFILAQVIDFTKNFTDVCHHGKEEDSLFPALEKAGMPTRMGPIAVMLMEHEKSREIASRMEISAKQYIQNNNSAGLISSMQEYVTHVTEHLWKENNKLFAIAETRLQHVANEVDSELNRIEDEKLKQTGNDRDHYEQIARELSKHADAGKADLPDMSVDWES